MEFLTLSPKSANQNLTKFLPLALSEKAGLVNQSLFVWSAQITWPGSKTPFAP